ncbi:MAG TPA: protein kinase [Gemmatimonadales bacterium]|nr:protein kinase [Gemmatimonadales bacterium]
MTIPERLRAALADRYRLERELGQGGMATVYLAADLKHDRNVALKVLRPELAAVLGAERFVQEIKTTAALQHPNILPLFDSGEADGFLYYVMPHVQGETLRDKLDRETQLGVDEAVRITVEAADALQYAHEQGIVHRDIKPENILLHGGRPMVADFGIALALSAAAGGRMTETGLSLGTPHYMSPEQATAEKNITNRSDIYSLGCVLYEMLTGDPPHTASSVQAIILKIVTDRARPVTDLRKSVPRNVADAVAKAIEKLPADRFETAKDFAAALTNPAFMTRGPHAAASAAPGARLRSRAVVFGLAAACVALAAVAAWGWLRPSPSPPTTREWIGLSLVRPEGRLYEGWSANLAIANDGSAIAFVDSIRGRNAHQLFLKEWDSDTAIPIPGTIGGANPFFSPDGRWIGFATAQGLFRIPRSGGAPVHLSDSTASMDEAVLASGVWLEDGTIVFPGKDNLHLFQIDADGGHQRVVLPARTLRQGLVRLEALPGTHGVLVTACGAQPCSPGSVWLLDLQRDTLVHLLDGVSSGWYLPTGNILYGRPDGTLFAQRFDLDRGRLTGTAIPVMHGLATTSGLPEIVVSPAGTILYGLRRDAAATGAESRLVWVDRHGTPTVLDSTLSLPGEYQAQFGVSLSPDGSRLAFVQNTTDGPQIFVRQMPDGPSTRLSSGGASGRPEWSPNGRDLLYIMQPPGAPSMAVRQPADGVGGATVVARDRRGVKEILLSPDGQSLLYRTESNAPGGGDLLARRLSGDTATVSLLATPAFEGEAAISPDGRWLAYVSSQGGPPEVYVRPWPHVMDGRWQVSRGGGAEPVWNPNGGELYYIRGDRELMAVRVDASPTFHSGEPQPLFSTEPYIGGNGHAGYLVSRDGRFLFGQQLSSGSGPSRLILVRHWFTELRPLLQAKP